MRPQPPVSWTDSLSGVFAFATATVLFAGCDGNDVPPPRVGEPDQGLRSAATTVDFRAPIVGAPMYPAASEEHVWVVDAHGNPGLHLIEAEQWELFMSFGRRGDGPAEFGQVPFGLIPFSEDEMLAWDPGNQRLIGFRAKSLSEYEPSTVTLDSNRLVVQIIRLEDRFVGQTNELGARFVVFDSAGQVVRESPVPFYGDSLTAVGDRVQATTSLSTLCAWPGRGFAVVNGMFGEIQYFDRDGEYLRSAEVPAPSLPVFSDDSPRRFQWPDRFHYMSCVVVEDRLLALYSGRAISQADGLDDAAHGRTLHGFTWDGRMDLQLNLPTSVRSVGWDPYRRRLLATSLNEAAVLVIDPTGLDAQR